MVLQVFASPQGCCGHWDGLVKMILHPRSAKGLKPMGVWGEDGMTCPFTASSGSAGIEASVVLAIDFTGSPLATHTLIIVTFGLRFLTGALGTKLIPLAPELAMPVWEMLVFWCKVYVASKFS